jgi:hypothetical protein
MSILVRARLRPRRALRGAIRNGFVDRQAHGTSPCLCNRSQRNVTAHTSAGHSAIRRLEARTRFEERRFGSGEEFLKLGEVPSPIERRQSGWQITPALVERGLRSRSCARSLQAGIADHYPPSPCSCWHDDASSSQDVDSRDSAERRSGPWASGRIRPCPTNAEVRLGRCQPRTSQSTPVRMTW